MMRYALELVKAPLLMFGRRLTIPALAVPRRRLVGWQGIRCRSSMSGVMM